MIGEGYITKACISLDAIDAGAPHTVISTDLEPSDVALLKMAARRHGVDLETFLLALITASATRSLAGVR